MKSLVFVYNASSGLINNVLDIGHKLIRPDTYSCNLCAITHNTFSENKTWKHFREHGNMEMIFYHKDEFEQEFPNQKLTYPIVLLKNNDSLSELLSREELNTMKNAKELIRKLVNNFK